MQVERKTLGQIQHTVSKFSVYKECTIVNLYLKCRQLRLYPTMLLIIIQLLRYLIHETKQWLMLLKPAILDRVNSVSALIWNNGIFTCLPKTYIPLSLWNGTKDLMIFLYLCFLGRFHLVRTTAAWPHGKTGKSCKLIFGHTFLFWTSLLTCTTF